IVVAGRGLASAQRQILPGINHTLRWDCESLVEA
ncbi:MAG: hypothetical protein K0Q62_1734, partial [Phenylobacterium sp.]|nr:hypothetical protein [Phenylobacterium sp.]